VSVQTPGTLRSHLVERLRDDILSGKYKPGDRLNESSIARAYNISRIPVREALFQLRESGLVMLRERRGMFVTALTEEEVHQISSVRVLLETEAFCLARENMTPNAAKMLGDHVSKMESMHGSLTTAAAMDLEFHRKVWALSGNEYLEKVLDPIATLLFAHNTLERVGPRPRGWLLNHHRKLLDALLGNEPTDLKAALINHSRAASIESAPESRQRKPAAKAIKSIKK
jgi:DNA-binding GntR family transcriptional regulator